ncbi:hypothetical protein [Flavobacterium sp.]|uniref:hypothetical protein n=1 Tax=Flavobacterium sp. TaxID=239 RepID=UPI002638A04C|nr:hypothetical protein [Flavobacterium sp.]
MQTTKVLYKLTLATALVLLFLGVVIQVFSVEDSGWFFNKQGGLVAGTLNGTGTICLGIILFFFAAGFRKSFIKKRDQRDSQQRKESNEELLGKKYNIHKLRRLNKR